MGIDVSKGQLDVAWGKERRGVANDAAGRKELAGWLSKVKGQVQVICEASGGYERALVSQLHKEGIAVSLVQVSRVRQYAKAAGILAKTDRAVRLWQSDGT